MITTRPEDWPARLHRFLESRSSTPFAWGSHDCALTACDWIIDMMGVDLAASFRGRYTTAIGAARVMRNRGGLVAIARDACARWDWPECRPSMARRGDVVSTDTIHRGKPSPMLGICVGDRAAFPAAAGLIFLPLNQCQRGWRIA